MAGKFSRSFQLLKESFAILRKDKEIMLFPIMSFICFILLFILFFASIHYLTDFLKTGKLEMAQIYIYLILFFVYIIIYFITVFFNTGLVTCAHIRLNGGNPTFGDGFRNAIRHTGKIFLWALVAATIGIILRIFSDKSKFLGKLVISILGAAWNLLTFFIVPILVFENLDVIGSIKRSGYLFKKTWGEAIIGRFSMNVFFVILVPFGFIPLVIAGSIKSFIAFVFAFTIMLGYWVFFAILNSSLNGIFVTALYNYTTTGKIPPMYNKEIIKNAFGSKKNSKPFKGGY